MFWRCFREYDSTFVSCSGKTFGRKPAWLAEHRTSWRWTIWNWFKRTNQKACLLPMGAFCPFRSSHHVLLDSPPLETFRRWDSARIFLLGELFFFLGGRLKFLVDGLKLAAFALEEKQYEIGGKKIPSKDEKWVWYLLISKKIYYHIHYHKLIINFE